ncbi:hypothetical protein [Okeania sp. SIO2B3]|uniref:hypothetical protein n=1 Tax=Okeania sp. SIO2B3 TaxID=2607784 RepID=UPI0013BF711A|nr:hypothetical protein [Okeania sp. SIO2B3]NET42478.1 hypothetical protein [Okeania sp. SIO2B3]
MRFTSLLVGVGNNPPLTPPPDGKTGEMGMSEEVEVRIVRMIFLPNYEPKILTLFIYQRKKNLTLSKF